MTKKGIRVTPKYKQVGFETAVRNPERYLGILSAILKYENKILDDECLLEIVTQLYLAGEVTSEEITILNETTSEEIKDLVVKVNSSRKADGGFPQGYASRFWTYMRTMSELGMVYARYKEVFKLSEIAKMLIRGEIDEQEAFSMQAMKYNRKSPYRNVSNDYNFFALTLRILLFLKEHNKRLSYEQFAVLMFNQSGEISETLGILSAQRLSNEEQTFKFLNNHYGNTNKLNTVMKDYPDVARRIMIISGFITIKYEGIKFIQINENKLNYIKELLSIEYHLTEEEKEDANKYFLKMESYNEIYLNIAKKYRDVDAMDGQKYTNIIYNIIQLYDIDEEKIIQCINDIGTKSLSIIPEFKEIPAPLKLEFYIAILIALKYKDEFIIKPNYKVDHIGKPYSHAPGNEGDIEIYSQDIYWLIEVTLIRNKIQQLNNETTSLVRHMHAKDEFKDHNTKCLSFIAPVVHEDTKDYLDTALIRNQVSGKSTFIKPYTIHEFLTVTSEKKNIIDMDNYSRSILDEYRLKLSL